MSRIFISYRRKDSAGYAGRLYDHLSQHFGKDKIFMDIDTIKPGVDFVETIEKAVGSCDVLIAVIGKQWLTIADLAGRRRLDNPGDFVRLEIKTALARNIRVIPALLPGAAMPQSQDLPDELAMLTRRNAIEISDARFPEDVKHLIKELDNVLGVSKPPSVPPHPSPRPPSRRLRLFVGIGVLVLVVTIGVFSFLAGQLEPSLPQTITASDGSPIVLIPAGPFTMGSDSGDNNEQRVPNVILDAFCIDQYEVTNARYADCVATGECKLPGFIELYEDPAKKNHPVVGVDWEQANTYCEWRGDRLPTEAEWEKAARGTDGRVYPWGNQWDETKLDSAEGGPGDTTPVGQYSPYGDSPYGVADMAGNVWEWVADWYDEDYYATAPSHNPQGPDNGEDKVLRGGSWYDGEGGARDVPHPQRT